MASDASVRAVDGRAVVRVFGAELAGIVAAGAAKSAGDAADSADASAQSAATAALAESGAVAAAGTLFPTTAAGLAATAANGFFTVVGDGTSTYAILYKKVGSEAVEQARYASKAAYEGPAGAAMIGTSGGETVQGILDRTSRSIRLDSFGFKGDAITDDTQAWRDAIAFAGATGTRRVIVPGGVSIVSRSIADEDNPLPPGLTFVGEGANCDNPYITQSRLRYTGSDTCWKVSYRTPAIREYANWTFDSISFDATDPAGTMFDFGDTETHTPHDSPEIDDYSFLQNVRFLNCYAWGGLGTGDFFRACKTFHIYADESTVVYNWRRGFWLKGCDNCIISARMSGNGRSVMIEGIGFFGNNNRIESAFLGGSENPNSGEPAYTVYDQGSKTTISRGTLLESHGSISHLYLNGYGAQIHSPQVGTEAPFFHLAPLARENTIYSPRATVVDYDYAPIIDPPANPNMGSSEFDYRLRIVDPPASIQAILPIHPRILLLDATRNPLRNAPNPFQPMRITAAGPMALSHTCTAYNYWGTPGAPGGGGIKEMYSDAALDGGYVMRLTKGTTVPANIPAEGPIEQGFALNFVMGVDINPGVYRITSRMRLAAGTSSAGWAFIVTVNGAFRAALTLPSSVDYATIIDTVDLTKTIANAPIPLGATVTINVYNASAGATGVDLLVQLIDLSPVADAGWTIGTGSPNKGAFAASASTEYAQAEAQSTMERVLALEGAMRAAGFIN
jgi:hypothetical protein